MIDWNKPINELSREGMDELFLVKHFAPWIHEEIRRRLEAGDQVYVESSLLSPSPTYYLNGEPWLCDLTFIRMSQGLRRNGLAQLSLAASIQ